MTLGSWLLTGLITAPLIAYNTVGEVHSAVNERLMSLGIPGERWQAGAMRELLSSKPVKKGDVIQGLRVTSGYGPRVHPVTGELNSHHNGVDIAAEIGTPVYAPVLSTSGTVRVSCFNTGGPAGIVALISSDSLPGGTIKLFHLNDCADGTHRRGVKVAEIGATGRVTGAHLHVEHIREGKHVLPTRAVVSALLTEHPLPGGVFADSREITDEDLACIIGAAEGTRDSNCQKTQSYTSHTDPGNGARNQGSFSYQHPADGPKDADRRQLSRLRNAERIIKERAIAAGVSLTTLEKLSILDQFNQAPAAAFGRAGTLDRIIDARAKSYIDPATGELDAPGLGNDMDNVLADQRRRTEQIIKAIEKRRLDQQQ